MHKIVLLLDIQKAFLQIALHYESRVSQQQSPQQGQGMDPLPGQKSFSPQGLLDESSGQTGACSSQTSQIQIPTPMVKPTW